MPSLTITPPPINSHNQGSYSFEGTCPEIDGPVDITVGTLSIQAECTEGVWRVEGLDVGSLTGSSVTITADGEDGAGNPAVQQSSTVDRDVVAPEVAIVSAEDITVTNKDSYSLRGTCSDDGENNVEVSIAGGSGVTVSCSSQGWAFSPTVANISDGNSLAVTVVHRDALGNEKTVRDEINKDTLAPEITVTSDLRVNAEEIAPYVLGGTCTDGDGNVKVEVAGYPDLDVPCTGGSWERSLTLNLGDETIAFTLSQTDASGNPSEMTGTIDKDTTPPAIDITRLDDMNAGNREIYIVVGTCERDSGDDRITLLVNGNIEIAHPSFVCPYSANALSIWYLFNHLDDTLRNLPDGNGITVIARYSDRHGNIGESPEHTFDKDTVLPVLSIDEPGEVTPANLAAYSLTGDCTKGDGVVTVSVETVSPDPQPDCNGSPGRWSTTVDLGPLGVGSRPITASQTDALGNIGSAPGKSLGIPGFRPFLLETISVGEGHTCTLKSDGGVSCWGQGTHEQLGDGTSASKSYPVKVISEQGSSDPLSDIIQVSSGIYHTCALKSNGTMSCWGDGAEGQLGDGTNVGKNYPVGVVSGQGSSDLLSGIIQVSSGASHTCALKSNGTVNCWGDGLHGQLGDGTNADKNYPVGVISGPGSTDPLSDIIQVSSGSYHTCALKSNGTVNCWGFGGNGRLGDSTNANRNYPVGVISGQGHSSLLSGIVQIALGGYHTCALKSDGTVSCWGYGPDGQLGHGKNFNSWYPVGVILEQGSSDPLSDIIQVSFGKVSYLCPQIEWNRELLGKWR